MITWLRGLALLRYPELVYDLGERRFHLLKVAEIRRRFPEARVDRNVTLISYAPSRLELGTKATLSSGAVLAFGDETNGLGRIIVGSGTWVGQFNNLRASGDADIRIGNDCLISQFCTLVGTNHAIRRGQRIAEQAVDTSRRGVFVEDDVWLGAGVTVLPGVTVGQGAVVGAGGVVTKDVPEYEIWGGVPAEKLGERE